MICRQPAFKTSTTMSRTQLKQQLQREQMKEQERMSTERFHNKVNQPQPIPVTPSVPVQPSILLPPNVLQVSTVLENPTQYHVIQKRKNQVRQFLTTSAPNTPIRLDEMDWQTHDKNQLKSSPSNRIPVSPKVNTDYCYKSKRSCCCFRIHLAYSLK